jgi:mannose-1-phosphate guanylyltransferase/mannose-6-phosphate isomerase
MLRATIDRAAGLGDTRDPIIVTNKDHADAITREMVSSGYAEATLILEPVGRNTAPAVAVAAMEVLKNGDALMLILPADHTIADEEAFRTAVANAKDAADSGYLVTFGIAPSRAETGYGYIRVGTPITGAVSRVAEFREKPDADTAQSYLDSGTYLWNSGMFLFKASRYLEELEEHASDIAASAALAFAKAETADGRVLLDPEAFSACRAESIDYAVMEPTSTAAVVPTDPGWNDVGSWSSLFDIGDKDDNNNVLVGDVISVDTSGTYARSSGRLIATVGVDDLIIVETPDAVLVAHQDSAQDVKAIVDRLKVDGRRELESEGTGLGEDDIAGQKDAHGRTEGRE